MMFGNILPIFNCGNFPLPNCSTVFTRRKAVADAGRDAGCGNVIVFFFFGGNGNFETFFCFCSKEIESYFPNVDILYHP